MELVENSPVIYEFGKFLVDPKERTLFADGLPVHLAAKEFDTLLLLLEHTGHVLTKEEMLAVLWRGSFVEESNLAKKISRLRKLLNTGGEEYIETIPKYGYRFNAAVRRSIVETESVVLLEKRTVDRLHFAVGEQPTVPALPASRSSFFSVARLGLLLLVFVGLGLSAWYFREGIFPTRVTIDPYAPVRLTDNPNDDSNPSWGKDGRIRFTRIYPDNRGETWVMNSDGSEQAPVTWSDNRRVLNWSPDEQKILFIKPGDATRTYLSNVDGSGETPIPRAGTWSADSKSFIYHQRVSANNSDLFIYSIETGESRNITNTESYESDPSFSPNGKQVLFGSSRDGNSEIYLMDLGTSTVRRLTYDPRIDVHASFSPDGTQILFNSDRENENGDVYVMNADGSGSQVKVTNWDKSNETAEIGSWSPDGTKIAFYSDRNGKDDIYVMSAETIRPKLLLSYPDRDLGTPSFSPDGKKLVYSAAIEDKSGELKVFDRETGKTDLLTKTELAFSRADWSPDGSWITFANRANGNLEIFRVRPDGSGLENLTNEPATDGTPSFSPDGSRLVLMSMRGEISGAQLWSMNADGTEPRPVTPRKGWENDPVWAPDGQRLIFTCDREDAPGNALDLCEIDPDGTNERHILYHRDHDVQPAVSPDGKRIAFVARSDGNLEIYLVNRDGSGLRRLTRHPADDQWPEWSPDGTTLIFSSNRDGKYAIYAIEV